MVLCTTSENPLRLGRQINRVTSHRVRINPASISKDSPGRLTLVGGTGVWERSRPLFGTGPLV